MKNSEAMETVLAQIINGRLYICHRIEDLVYSNNITWEQCTKMQEDVLKMFGIKEGSAETAIRRMLRKKGFTVIDNNYLTDLIKASRVKCCEYLIQRYKKEEENEAT